MKLFDRNYCVLTKKEKHDWDILKEKEIVYVNGEPSLMRKSYFLKYPKAVRHYLSLFPNNYLDIVDLKEVDILTEKISAFNILLSKKTITERKILNFIKKCNSYFIIGSILKNYYHFGHHDTFIFPEFMLGNSHKVDYLLIGSSSDGYQFVMVELEKPEGRITTKKNELGDVFRKGVTQIETWNRWIEAHFVSLCETFDKHKNANLPLSEEFTKYDSTRFNFCVIAGRRNHFNSSIYRLKREYKGRKVTLLHYDNLIDSAKNIIGKSTY